ncbi:MAG TPA: HAMP domain-containing histidine kinase [Saprospiraceae bacterium]|nr:HAMP domain-containing histidine kinase [Saprospiraceae bacterium]
MSRKQKNNIYSVKSRWKWYLGLAGLFIVLLSLAYTYYLSRKIQVEERHKVQHIALAIQSLQDTVSYLTLVTKILDDNLTTPLILVNDRGGIDQGKNFGKGKESDTLFLRKELNKIIKNGGKPFVVSDQYNTQFIYYKQSRLLTQLNYMPFIQLLLISAFIMLGYLAFSAARETEQNLVWVGMAKETAHQLGTPITAIVAWIEHLKMVNPEDEMTQNIVQELRKDVTRLELIAERFSKVGSTPDLVPTNLTEELQKVIDYMRARSPKRMKFSLNAEKEEIIGDINAPLFDWVIENLIRNALDAMQGQGSIDTELKLRENRIIITISDTGKGIPGGKLKTIFNPGYTTKTRGWGLGLSLSKRIIESYHSGKIFVKSSIVGKGTTFEIDLPLHKE